MGKDLLFEIGTEELPARFINPALQELERLAKEEFEVLGLSFKEIKTLGTPRRLTLYVCELAEYQPDRVEEIIGPPKKVAFDKDGRPTKALEGFAKKQGVSITELRIKQTQKGPYVYVEKRIPGKETKELLLEVLPRLIIRASFPKSMRWSNYKIRFARPIRWLLAIYDGEPVQFEIAGVISGNLTYGHRFMRSEPIEVKDIETYVQGLRKAFVIVEPEKRLACTLDEISRAASSCGGFILEDQDLLEENANLVEFPYAILGSFEEKFLAIPRPVLITAMREHQRYFAVVDAEGRLLPKFVAVNNTKPDDPSLVIAGHERVLKARLEDAKFYFERDKKIALADRVKELSQVGYHARLGSIYDKVKRLEALASWLTRRLKPKKMDIVCRAAWLCKADLVTEIVQEFPSLQGQMGKEYALLSGESEEVAQAIYEHYLPIRADGQLPKSIPGAILAMADKIDTICAFFAIEERPSGASDPYGLRRAAYGFINIVLDKKFVISLKAMIEEALRLLKGFLVHPLEELLPEILAFIGRRLEGELVSRGFANDLVQAVMAVGFDDLADTYRRLEALKRIRESRDFPALAIGFKRVMNMVKKVSQDLPFDETILIEDEEKMLWQSYLETKEGVSPLIEAGRYAEALQQFLKLKQPIDCFFDKVFVMVEDQILRENRLALLQRIAKLFLRIADLSYLREEMLKDGL